MKIRLLACGTRMPKWVNAGFEDYRQRLRGEVRLELVEITPGKRTKGGSSSGAMIEEARRMEQAMNTEERIIALEVTGMPWSTADLSKRMQQWLAGRRDVALLVGGPDGLAESCRGRASASWSLSPLTLPHALVRVLVAEQIYRAWTILHNHPYHRA